ncbi:MAG TPA: hypothetical protein VG347_09410 [Verrucomicrobiae bacterium]|nr:hypothetical protein [Verrucomicrobiae bacterium]
MLARLTFFVLLMLNAWTALSVIRIERLNAEAGLYLPRHIHDGKWRISPDNTPCDRLRELVNGIGLFQYLLAPLVIGLSAFVFVRKGPHTHHIVAIFTMAIGLAALGLAFYRDYLSSLV